MTSGSSVKPIRTLFTSNDGSSLTFYLRPCPLKTTLRPLIEEWGGSLTHKSWDSDAFHLVEPNVAVSSNAKNCIRIQYIQDCIDKRLLLSVDNYRVSGQQPSLADYDPEFEEDLYDCTVRTTAKNTKARKEYTTEEDKKIISYLLKKDTYNDIGGNRLWLDMENSFDSRSWQSLKERFRKRIQFNLEMYSLSPKDHRVLKRRCGLWTKKDDKKFELKMEKLNEKNSSQTNNEDVVKDTQASNSSQVTGSHSQTQRVGETNRQTRKDKKGASCSSDEKTQQGISKKDKGVRNSESIDNLSEIDQDTREIRSHSQTQRIGEHKRQTRKTTRTTSFNSNENPQRESRKEDGGAKNSESMENAIEIDSNSSSSECIEIVRNEEMAGVLQFLQTEENKASEHSSTDRNKGKHRRIVYQQSDDDSSSDAKVTSTGRGQSKRQKLVRIPSNIESHKKNDSFIPVRKKKYRRQIADNFVPKLSQVEKDIVKSVDMSKPGCSFHRPNENTNVGISKYFVGNIDNCNSNSSNIVESCTKTTTKDTSNVVKKSQDSAPLDEMKPTDRENQRRDNTSAFFHGNIVESNPNHRNNMNLGKKTPTKESSNFGRTSQVSCEDNSRHSPLNIRICTPLKCKETETTRVITPPTFEPHLLQSTIQTANSVDVKKLRNCLTNKMGPAKFRILTDSEQEISPETTCHIIESPNWNKTSSNVDCFNCDATSEEILPVSMKKSTEQEISPEPICLVIESLNWNKTNSNVDGFNSDETSEEILPVPMKRKSTDTNFHVELDNQCSSDTTEFFEAVETRSNLTLDSYDEDIMGKAKNGNRQKLMYQRLQEKIREKINSSKGSQEDHRVSETLTALPFLEDVINSGMSNQSEQASSSDQNQDINTPASPDIPPARYPSAGRLGFARKRLHLSSDSDRSTENKIQRQNASKSNQENRPQVANDLCPPPLTERNRNNTSLDADSYDVQISAGVQEVKSQLQEWLMQTCTNGKLVMIGENDVVVSRQSLYAAQVVLKGVDEAISKANLKTRVKHIMNKPASTITTQDSEQLKDYLFVCKDG